MIVYLNDSRGNTFSSCNCKTFLCKQRKWHWTIEVKWAQNCAIKWHQEKWNRSQMRRFSCFKLDSCNLDDDSCHSSYIHLIGNFNERILSQTIRVFPVYNSVYKDAVWTLIIYFPQNKLHLIRVYLLNAHFHSKRPKMQLKRTMIEREKKRKCFI